MLFNKPKYAHSVTGQTQQRLSAILFISLTFLTSTSCKKFITLPPPKDEMVTESIFSSEKTANSAVLGIYQRFYDLTMSRNLSKTLGLYGDEFLNFSTGVNEVDLYSINLQEENTITSGLWTSFYQIIYHSNSILSGVDQSKNLSSSLRNQLKGEAKFFRAFCYFNLYNLFGNVPLAAGVDYNINSRLQRSDSATVYKFIVDDLLSAEQLVNDKYVGRDGVSSYSERGRINKAGVQAFLAKVYLQQGDYLNAEKYASDVINNPLYTPLSNLTSFFLKNNSEAILQIAVLPDNTVDGNYYILTTTPSASKVSLDTTFVKSFSVSDKRLANWIGSVKVGLNTFYFPYKYKVALLTAANSEYTMVLRLGEQYLIRAEALAKQNKLEESKADLNTIRNRNGLPNTLAVTQTELIDSVYIETRKEMFSEWTNGWLALKRYHKFDEIMTQVAARKNGEWKPWKRIWPIPQSEINANQNLLPQNEGY